MHAKGSGRAEGGAEGRQWDGDGKGIEHQHEEILMDVRTDEDRFHLAYERLASEGHCDSAGGMEYKRVRRQWEEAGRPEDIDSFIKAKANELP
jgi:hypothetical protein